MNCKTPCLGRLKSAIDRRTIQLTTIMAAALPPPPTSQRWQDAVKVWGTMGNDRYGNCVIVTAAHMLLNWRANKQHDPNAITDAAVIQLSKTMGALDGYNILDRLKYWRSTGMWSDFLWAFAQVQPSNHDLIKTAIADLGTLDVGVMLPNAWRNADEWTSGPGPKYRPNSWGPHSVPLVGYDETHVFAASWGQVFPMTWAAVDEYIDEAFAPIDSQWIAPDGRTPSGIDLPTLVDVLRSIGANDPQVIPSR